MSAGSLGRAIAAEFEKLRSIPLARFAVLGTVVAAAVIGYANASGFADAFRDGGLEPVAASIVASIPFVQVGMILIGVVPLGQEYSGRVLRTSLAAVPSRTLLVCAKTIAVIAVSFGAALLAMAGAWGGALLGASGEGAELGTVQGDFGEALREGEWATLLGAVAYLVLMALIAHAITLLLGGLVAGLVASLALVLLASPMLSGLGEFADWLPDRAAAVLYSGPSESLGEWGGPLVAVGWIALLFAAGTVRFSQSEP